MEQEIPASKSEFKTPTLDLDERIKLTPEEFINLNFIQRAQVHAEPSMSLSVTPETNDILSQQIRAIEFLFLATFDATKSWKDQISEFALFPVLHALLGYQKRSLQFRVVQSAEFQTALEEVIITSRAQLTSTKIQIETLEDRIQKNLQEFMHYHRKAVEFKDLEDYIENFNKNRAPKDTIQSNLESFICIERVFAEQESSDYEREYRLTRE
jgi:hypothetical protein